MRRARVSRHGKVTSGAVVGGSGARSRLDQPARPVLPLRGMRIQLVGSFMLAGVLAIASVGSAAIVTQPLSDSLTPDALANQILGAGVTISNVTVRGCPGGLGTFSGGTGIVGFDSGIILSSGDISTVVG